MLLFQYGSRVEKLGCTKYQIYNMSGGFEEPPLWLIRLDGFTSGLLREQLEKARFEPNHC